MKRLNEDIYRKRRTTSLFLVSLFIFSLLISIIPIKIVGLNSSDLDRLVLIEAPSGSGVTEIAEKLAKGGVIPSRFKFTLFTLLGGQGANLKSGNYIMSEEMSYFDVIDRLVKGPKMSDKKLFTVVIPEGFTAKQIAARFENIMDLDRLKLENMLLDGESLDFGVPTVVNERPTGSLEGYLFPKTYLFTEGDDESSVVQEILSQFNREVSSVRLKKVMGKEYSLHEILTIASLIEKEVKVESERELVSAVIHNRLKKGMALQICATVQYVLPERKEELTLADLKFDSPYNTYLHPGFPPGPICNPGLSSIKAALNPASVDYLYYVLTDSAGNHTFTSSYEEFQAAKAKAKNGF
ncbi:MAG: endolytic transglycosylase MltG [Actinomycetota bacterium]|nr:endolytic transglycosylase MltG [Actinomycetota bacterium]